jgi:hypothetical protein
MDLDKCQDHFADDFALGAGNLRKTEVHLRHLFEVPRLVMRESHSVEVSKHGA